MVYTLGYESDLATQGPLKEIEMIETQMYTCCSQLPGVQRWLDVPNLQGVNRSKMLVIRGWKEMRGALYANTLVTASGRPAVR